MAEVFGAVANGAGLVSLSMQLIESAQKLKRLYNASRDAPSTVADLCFELETVSLSLRQLDSRRTTDICGDELLGRCVTTCTRMVLKIHHAVSKIEHLLLKSHIGGRLYMAFKEPEIDRLLVEMEHAKSSMSFAYMSYCHSWSVSEASRHAAMNRAQNAVLSSHGTRLQGLERSVQKGNAAILARLNQPMNQLVSHHALPQGRKIAHLNTAKQTKQRAPKKFRVALPRWFIGRVWEFGFHQSENGWELRLHPVTLRPRDSFVFDVVSSGNVAAVRSLLASRELSVRDQFPWEVGGSQNILEMAALGGHIKLCAFLLDETSAFKEDAIMHGALQTFLDYSYNWSDSDQIRRDANALYHMFISRHGMLVEKEAKDNPHYLVETVLDNMLLTEESVKDILASQLIPFVGLPFEHRFSIAMRSKGWPASTFLKFLHCENPMQLATQTDSSGRTALHWAAEHLSYWASTTDARDELEAETQMENYAALLAKLVDMGADIHATTDDFKTPLTSLLMSMLCQPDSNQWNAARLLEWWGDMIMDSNQSLEEYVEIANTTQKRMAHEWREYSLRDLPHEDLVLDKIRLLVLDDLTLALQLNYGRIIPVWEYLPPPGTWNISSQVTQRIMWDPEETEETDDALLWEIVGEVEISSAPYVVRYVELPWAPAYSMDALAQSWRDLFGSTQDDTGQVARVARQEREVDSATTPTSRRRASSAPPPMVYEMDYSQPHAWQGDLLVAYTPTGMVHKCISNSRWTKGPGDSRRLCMQGRCRALWDFVSAPSRRRNKHWEYELLRDTKKTDIALRYADRFHPGLRRIIEENYMKARRWTELE